MASTPEGKVKKLVNKVLDEFDGEDSLYRYWPVPSGFGASSLDCIVCFKGYFISIETKAPKKKPTPRQELTIARIRAAGGIVLVIDDEIGCYELRVILQEIKDVVLGVQELCSRS